jgi:hypothetical protein
MRKAIANGFLRSYHLDHARKKRELWGRGSGSASVAVQLDPVGVVEGGNVVLALSGLCFGGRLAIAQTVNGNVVAVDGGAYPYTAAGVVHS